MKRHLSLVESDFELMEKRVLPRFPFCYLTFKDYKDEEQVFEVKDISNSGMQICLKNGDHAYNLNSDIKGNLSWLGNRIDIAGTVKWSKENRLGVEFLAVKNLKNDLLDFLKIDNFIDALKPIHKVEYGTSLPKNLSYWLRADGPVEIFVWSHSNGELSKFQILIMEHFVEWEDGEGLRTGRVISKRDVDTPLVSSDEFVFNIDQYIDDEKIEKAAHLCLKIKEDKLPSEALDFIKLKLGI